MWLYLPPRLAHPNTFLEVFGRLSRIPFKSSRTSEGDPLSSERNVNVALCTSPCPNSVQVQGRDLVLGAEFDTSFENFLALVC